MELLFLIFVVIVISEYKNKYVYKTLNQLDTNYPNNTHVIFFLKGNSPEVIGDMKSLIQEHEKSFQETKQMKFTFKEWDPNSVYCPSFPVLITSDSEKGYREAMAMLMNYTAPAVAS